jgi:flagellar assembly protein FliH
LSRIIKSVTANPSGVSWQLGIQSIKTKVSEIDNQHENEQIQTDKVITEKKNELIQLENNEQVLLGKLDLLEKTISEKNERLEQLSEQLELETEQIKQKAHKDGFEDGYQEGITRANNEYERLLDNAREIVKSIEAEKMNRIDTSKEIMVELSIQIARKIISDTLLENKDAWRTMLKDAITEIKEKGEIKLFVHPNQYHFTIGIRGEFELNPQTSISVYPDTSVEEFHCLIETNNGLIDASVDTQLEVIREKLIEVVKGETD